ncbi:hypothetical protein [[Actinomadura] parvosata]|uniref:hypothetical protein n=1 Tax=[Actinomadura] parvosata TaxID=1955412 RepID=UPI001C91EC25
MTILPGNPQRAAHTITGTSPQTGTPKTGRTGPNRHPAHRRPTLQDLSSRPPHDGEPGSVHEDQAEGTATQHSSYTQQNSCSVRYTVRDEQLTDEETARLGPEIAETAKRWHADIEALRVIHLGLRILAD